MDEHWAPDLGARPGTLHDRLLAALRDDIAAGHLEPGAKLPPHRALASRLGIGVGTVTRAYAEAEHLGLLTSTVGRGTFVAARQPEMAPEVEADEDGVIDLSLNLQSLTFASRHIHEALARIQLRPDLTDVLSFSPHAGLDWHRQALASWLRDHSRFAGLDWRRLAIVTGAQNGMAITIDELCRRGEIVLTEAATFSGFLAIAAYRGVRCEGLAMDEHGVIPEALEEGIRRFGSRVLYLQPTLHNPTTRTMPMARREAIVAIARRYDVSIVEDDVYSAIGLRSSRSPADVVPIATLAPERTWYSGSVSKALAPGLRVGMVVAPDALDFDRLTIAIRAHQYATSSLGPLVVAQWIKDGVAEQILGAVAEEARQRVNLARQMLGKAVETPSLDTSLHLWMPMDELAAERFANTALRRGVVLTPPSSFLVDGSLVSGLRICLNRVSRPQLERALRILRSVLADTLSPARHAIV